MKKAIYIISSVLLALSLHQGASAQTNQAPYFHLGDTAQIRMCTSDTVMSLYRMSAVVDSNAGQLITWSVAMSASHGSISGLSITDTASAGIDYQSGILYRPTTGYSGLDTFALQIADDSGAVDTIYIYANILGLPDAGTLSGDSVVCVGSSITLTASVSGGTWGMLGSRATDTAGVIRGVSAGADTATYTVTNACGNAMSSHALTVMAAPILGTITGASSVCRYDTITVHASTAGGSWHNTAHATTLIDSNIIGVSAGIDTITYIVANFCGSDTTTHTVRVDTAAPSAHTITGLATLCVGDSITLTDSAVGGTWSSLATSIARINSVGVVRGVARGNATLVYSISNSCGVVADSHSVVVQGIPSAGRIVGYDSVCVGSTITLRDSVTGGTWISSESDFVSVTSAGVASGNLFGSAIISYIVRNACGSDTATHRVNVNIPAPPIGGSNTICFPGFTVLTNGLSGGTWSSSNPFIAFVFAGNVVGIGLGTATISYRVNNACGNTAATHDIEVLNCPPAGVTEVSSQPWALQVMPNPSHGQFTIAIDGATQEEGIVTITNLLGQTVHEMKQMVGSTNDINLSLAPGIYQLQIALPKQNRNLRSTLVIE